MENTVLQNKALGQSTWIDYIRRAMLTTGELGKLVREGVTGLTSNPTIFEKAVSGSNDYDDALSELARAGKSPAEVFEALTIEDIQGAADILRGIYDETDGVDGYASLEVRPTLANDTESTVREARRLWATLRRPNVMIKVPATPAGMPAIRTLIGEGMNVNVTLIFSLEAYKQVMDAYVAGLEALVDKGMSPSRAASVASFFVSRVDTAVDALLGERTDLQGKAAIANAQAAYALFEERFSRPDFVALAARGARVQRPLWASTSTKNPSYPDTLYVDALVGANSVNTMPPDTLQAVLDHGVSATTIAGTGEQAKQTLQALAEAGVDMEAVTAKLLADGVDAFAKSFGDALASIEAKCGELVEAGG